MLIYVPSLHDVGLRVLRLSKWHLHGGELPPINFVSSLVSSLEFVVGAMHSDTLVFVHGLTTGLEWVNVAF